MLPRQHQAAVAFSLTSGKQGTSTGLPSAKRRLIKKRQKMNRERWAPSETAPAEGSGSQNQETLESVKQAERAARNCLKTAVQVLPVIQSVHETLFLGMTAASKAGKMNHEMSK